MPKHHQTNTSNIMLQHTQKSTYNLM